MKSGIRFFNFGKCLNLICSNSFWLDISEMFRAWWKSMRFKIDLTLLYNDLDSLSNLLTTSLLLQISSRKSYLWHRLYVEEEHKLKLATLKRKNFRMTLWFSQIFKNWRYKRAFLRSTFVFSTFLTNFNVWSPYLFPITSAMESLDGNLSLVRKINNNDITKS